MANKAKRERESKTQLPDRRAALRAPTVYSDRELVVDEANGILKNVSLMTIGPALGHGFEIDGTTLDNLVSLASQQAEEGVKSRFKHPAINESRDPYTGDVRQQVADDTGTLIGRIKNVRRDGDRVRGDIYIGSYAEVMPGLGNVKDYLIRHAKDDPSGIGMSAFFSFDLQPLTDDFGNVLKQFARLTALDGIDVVSQPAANPKGLLSAKAAAFDPQPPSAGWEDPNPKDQATAQIPANDKRIEYLRSIVKDGPMHLGGLAARHNGRLEEMRAGADWLVNKGYAERVPMGKAQGYKATPKGITLAACAWA